MALTPERTTLDAFMLGVLRSSMVLMWVVAATFTLHGQVIFNIADGDVVTCTGAMVDSGGEGGPGYSDDESITATICPDQPGQAISLNTVIFNLSAAGTAPTDVLNIYDGPTTSDPLIGSYYSGQSPGIVTASFANPTGCLTVEFISNETGTGAFAFAITCFVPCQPPVAAAVMSEPSPAMICQGEEVTFDGSGSYAATGYNVIQYTWYFGDGSVDSTSGPVVLHIFPDPPGEHIVQLMVEDDNDCVNTNSVELQVLISTTPTFSGLDNEIICLGESVTLDAEAEAVTWTGQPNVDFGNGILLPDELGVVFTSPLTLNQFAAGQTMTSLDDIIAVCVEMEHSYMGDFVLQLTSPTGETIIFHQQGGGTTYLGEPVDDENQPNAIGTCYQYCFSPTATNGTWVDNATFTAVPLPAGTYESVQPFTNLLGSQLNGTWTISFTDLFGIDNGYICSWWIDFDPSLLPEVTVYTPVLDLTDPDSASWSGPGLVTDPGDPTQATFTPIASGTDTLTFTVVDNFGCAYDTTLNVTVTPAAVVDATSILPDDCGDPVQLNAILQSPAPVGPIIYQWSPSAGLSNTTYPYPSATPDVDTWYVVSVYPAGHPLCGSSDSVFVNQLTWLENDSLLTDALCHGDGTGSIEVLTSGNGGPWNYAWTDAEGNVVQSTAGADGDVFFGSGGLYTVVITEGLNGNGCADSLQALITEPSPVEMLTVSADTIVCRDGTATLTASAQGGTGQLAPHWSDGATEWIHPIGPMMLTTTRYVWATDENGCTSDTLDVEVTVRAPLTLLVPDTVVTCPDLDTELILDSAYGGDENYAFAWSSEPFQLEPSYVVNLQDTTVVCVTLTDGCETPDVTRCIVVAVKPIPELVLSADTLLGCDPFAVIFSVHDTTHAAVVDWNFGDGIVVPGPPENVGHTYTDPGIFTVGVTVHWPNGCDDDTTIAAMITVAAVPDAQFSWDPAPASTLDPTVQFVEQAGPFAVNWVWDFAGLDTAHGPEVEFTFPGELGDLYPVQLVASNYLGCTDTVIRNIEVMDEFLVFIPTAFTPNDDGMNDQLFVLGDDIDTKDYLLMIFDRWGELIFESSDRSEGWDGSYKGTPVQDGVYNWRLNARSFNTGKPHKLSGHVVVTR